MSPAERYAIPGPNRRSVSRTSSTTAAANSAFDSRTAISPSQPGNGRASTFTSIGYSGRNA
jgi:hypothetical protein